MRTNCQNCLGARAVSCVFITPEMNGHQLSHKSTLLGSSSSLVTRVYKPLRFFFSLTLLPKPSRYAILENDLKWFCYLPGLTYCKVSRVQSSFQTLNCGIPQSSCLSYSKYRSMTFLYRVSHKKKLSLFDKTPNNSLLPYR